MQIASAQRTNHRPETDRVRAAGSLSAVTTTVEKIAGAGHLVEQLRITGDRLAGKPQGCHRIQ